MDAGIFRSLMAVILGLALAYLLILLINSICVKNKLPQPKIGNKKGLFIGLGFGFVASFASGIAFQLHAGQPPDYSGLLNDLHLRLLGNLFPASIEEVAFRYGIVHSISALFNNMAGVFAGSLPFGLIHVFGRLFGLEVGFFHVLGVTTAGVLLSLLYLRHGLLASFSCHWIWNS